MTKRKKIREPFEEEESTREKEWGDRAELMTHLRYHHRFGH